MSGPPNEERDSPVPVTGPANRALQPEGSANIQPGHDVCLEFVRFCYRRRRVSWPELYDEMCAVAARGSFRGLGYAELADFGITFSLSELPRLVALTQQVVHEERPVEAVVAEVQTGIRLTAAAASG